MEDALGMLWPPSTQRGLLSTAGDALQFLLKEHVPYLIKMRRRMKGIEATCLKIWEPYNRPAPLGDGDTYIQLFTVGDRG